MNLPAMMTTIDSEAFVGIAAEAVRIPASVNEIAIDAFDEGIIIIATSGSDAAEWAAANHFECVIENLGSNEN